MLLAMVFALAAPPTFVQAVQARAAAAKMHVADWWQDDLDGDKTPEAIALVCNEEAGIYVVQHGTDLLEAPAEIDGRNPCPVTDGTPAFRAETKGRIAEHVNVHHGAITYWLAIRSGKLVVAGEDSSSIDVDRDGTTTEEDHADYDALTWTASTKPPHGRVQKQAGPLVLVTDVVRRPAKLVGKSTLAATRNDSGITLHVHADRVLVITDCSNPPCKTTRLAAGDSVLPLGNPFALDVIAGRSTIHVRLQPLDGDQTYPPPPAN